VERQQSSCMPSICSRCEPRTYGSGRSKNAANSFVNSSWRYRTRSGFLKRFDVPVSELIREVRQHQLEGIVAKRTGTQYRSGERSGDWLNWRANRGQEFVIGGYIPNGDTLDSILVGYYNGR
jgi:ATP-dependent DNA ligase